MATKPRKKYKSNTPVVFAIPRATLNKLKLTYTKAIQSFKDGTHTANDWNNVTFRIKAGLEIAKIVYEEITIKDMQEAFDVCMVIHNRFLETNIWSFNNSELEIIELGVEVTGVMYEEVTRRIMLDATHIADEYMQKLVN